MVYSALKQLMPSSLRTFLRDLDSAYQEKLKEIEIKNKKILELENNYKELLKEVESAKIHSQEQQAIDNGIDNSSLSNEDYNKLSQAGLFIVGNARSGTSILGDCLNLSHEVFLLAEANLALHYNLNNFVDYFNEQHIRYKNRRAKGTFAPPSRLPEKGGLAFLARMQKNYKFIGEKIAFGPDDTKVNNQDWQERFFNFHATYFYFSNYILIMRRPTETVWSMLKNFPEKRLSVMFKSWLRTTQIQIDIFQAFPNAYIVFFENVDSQVIFNLCSLIGIKIEIPESMIRNENKYSLLSETEIPNKLLEYSEICISCENIFNLIKKEFNLNTFKFKDTTANYGAARYGFSDNIQKLIDETISNLAKFK